MINIKKLIPGKPTHPGAILLDELEARGLKQQEFARQIGMQKSQLNEIIKGKRSINAELAVLLEKALDIRAGYWLDAQQGYDLDLARKAKSVQERATALELWKLAKNFVSEKFLKAQNLISGDPMADIVFIKKLFGVYTIDELAIRTTATGQMYRKSQKAQTDPLALQTWVALVKYRAEDQVLPPFDQKSKDDVVKAVRELINENENLVEKVKQTLNQRGIKFVHQEKAEKVPVDGMSCWSEGRPLIGMTLRRRKIDNFAFTLFHELGHVYLHLANSNEACFVDLEIDKPGSGRQEDEADAFARDCLISPVDWKRFDQAAEPHNPDFIVKFSKEIGVHPAVLAGRSCFETGYYNWSKGDIDYAIN